MCDEWVFNFLLLLFFLIHVNIFRPSGIDTSPYWYVALPKKIAVIDFGKLCLVQNYKSEREDPKVFISIVVYIFI